MIRKKLNSNADPENISETPAAQDVDTSRSNENAGSLDENFNGFADRKDGDTVEFSSVDFPRNGNADLEESGTADPDNSAAGGYEDRSGYSRMSNQGYYADRSEYGERGAYPERSYGDRGASAYGETQSYGERSEYEERGYGDRFSYGNRQGYGRYGNRQGYGNYGNRQNYGNYGDRQNYGNYGDRQNYGNYDDRQNYGNYGDRQNYGNYGDRQNYGNYGDRQNYGNYGDRQNYGNYGDRQNYGNYGDRQGYGNYGDRQGYGGYGGYGNNYRFNRMRPRMNKMRTSNDPIFAADPFKTETGEDLQEMPISGILELHPNGYGFLRCPDVMYTRQLIDPFVPGNMIESYGLREGVFCTGIMTPGRKNQGPRLKEMLTVEGKDPESFLKVPSFDELTAVIPEKWYNLETGMEPLTTRVMDLLTPLGRGQRALIVAPPRTGKTMLLQQISNAIATNHPEVKLFVLLIDERPEEVTDMQRALDGKGEVIASSLDRDIESHVRLSQLMIERCKRLAENGQHVVLLLDSITRLARAFNKWVGNTGRTMSGGVDIKAMDIPKKLFATARQFENIEIDGEVREGGSLTIIGTALIETGSRMDELIFQEFKGTGNMELVLDRKLADRRIWPAMDVSMSGTRREEKLLNPEVLHAVTLLRRTLATMNPIDAMEQLTQKLMKYKSNAEFLTRILQVRE